MKDISSKDFIPQDYIYHDNLINIMAKDFNNHPKGLAEWLKNSIDAYTADKVNRKKHNIVFRFNTGKNSSIECIDFVGMEERDIEEGFKKWGDPNASKRGKEIDTFGGHGNGGKLYMFHMFSHSYFITYKKGLLNVFGFNEKKKYGYYGKNKKIDPKEALNYAGIHEDIVISNNVKNNIINKKIGFTIIRGVHPINLTNKQEFHKIINGFRNHSQAKRIFNHSNVSVIFNNDLIDERITPKRIEPHHDIKGPFEIVIPEIIESKDGGKKIYTFDSKHKQGKLILKTAENPLNKEQNIIEFLAKKGVLASNYISTMPTDTSPPVGYVYGECELPILESGDSEFIPNDRSALIESEFTDALLIWISKEIDKIASAIGDIEQENDKEKQKNISSKYNTILNDWMNKNIENILSDGLSGLGDNDYSPDSGGNGGKKGINITLPPNDFNFKYPMSEILINTESNITLKISVPDALPIGGVIRVSSNSKIISLSDRKYVITSERIKKTPKGQKVAFINIEVTGKEKGTAILMATAGHLSAETEIKVVTEKSGRTGKQKIQVLLSGIDKDPLGLIKVNEGILYLNEREKVIYQRPKVDVNARIYWINTASPLAAKIKNTITFESDIGKNFLFERYVDIFISEGLQKLNKDNYENLNTDAVSNKISDIMLEVHKSAAESLYNFLLTG